MFAPKIQKYFDVEVKKGKYTRNYIIDPLSFYEYELNLLSDVIDDNDIIVEYGCGSGSFLNILKENYKDNIICGFDISKEMLLLSRNKMGDSVYLLMCDVLHIPFRNNVFDIIYEESLLHHVISYSRSASKECVKKIISNVTRLLKPHGLYLLKEEFYNSYFIDTITSNILFWLLSLFSKYGYSLPIKEASKDLIISFYSTKELLEFIDSNNGGILKTNVKHWNVGLKEKLFLVKERGVVFHLIDFT